MSKFIHTVGPVPDEVRQNMKGVSMHPGCPVGFDGLAYLQMTHWGMDGEVHQGQLIVAVEHGPKLVGVFQKLFEAKFPIERMKPVWEFGGSDDKSMAANNTSAFNCRAVTGGKGWSQHSYGNAIDINTVQNPYVRGARVLPPAGKDFVDRSIAKPGMILDGDVVVTAFKEIGWKWGGDWTKLKDYQHFSSNGR